jgi:hypothetical protein
LLPVNGNEPIAHHQRSRVDAQNDF